MLRSQREGEREKARFLFSDVVTLFLLFDFLFFSEPQKSEISRIKFHKVSSNFESWKREEGERGKNGK